MMKRVADKEGQINDFKKEKEFLMNQCKKLKF